MKTFVEEKEFIFNEMEYFTNLVRKENLASENEEEYLRLLNIQNDIYKFEFKNDNVGSNYLFCFKNDIPVNWDSIENWLRSYVWDFEKENKIYY
jgi:hypothetical protein